MSNIEYILGNVIDAPEKIILHGANAQGRMNSGCAKAIRDKWPNAYDRYKEHYDWYVSPHMNGKVRVGDVVPAKCDDKIIINGITQEFYGRDKNVVYVDYKAVRQVLVYTRMILKHFDQSELATVFIGAGLANGKWSIIAPIIESELKDFSVKVYYMTEEEKNRIVSQ